MAFFHVLTQTDCTGDSGVYMGNVTWCGPNPRLSGVDDTSAISPLSVLAAPSASTGQVMIRYTLPKPTTVTIEVFDAAGSLVRRIALGQRPTGTVSAFWDGRDSNGREVSTGLYVARMVTEQSSTKVRLVVVR